MDKILSELHPFNLRYLFYLVHPNETLKYSRMEDVPNVMDHANLWLLLLVVIEYFFLDERKFAFNDTITSVNAGVLSIMMKYGGKAASAHFYPYVYSKICLVEMDPHAVHTWIVGLFMQDFIYYLCHRAVHEFGVFWSFHQMHHSSEYYNLSTALRQGIFQDFGTMGLELMQATFVPPPIFIIHRYLNVLYQFWLHTEMVPHLGPLEYFINTPSSHRVHHGRNPYCIDKNYGGTLIIWDILFGTYEPERKEEKIAYGLVDNVKSFDQLWCQLFEFKAIGWDKGWMRSEDGKELFPGWMNKLKTAFMPPGYFPGVRTKWFFFWKCVEDSEEGIPQIEENVVPFNSPLSKSVKLYLALQFFFMIGTALHLNENRTIFSSNHYWCLFVFIVTTMQMTGYYFDQRRFCVLFDAARLLAVAYYGFISHSLIAIVMSGLSTVALIAISFAGQMPTNNKLKIN